MEKKQTYRRGEIYLANLDPCFGSEQGGTRPVLVLQNDVGNYHSPTLIVAPLTGNPWKKPNFPTHCWVEAREKLMFPSIAMLEQIATIDKSRIIELMGQLDKSETKRIDRTIEISLGLRDIPKRQRKERTNMRVTRRDRYNGSGCLDMTAYLAMKNIAREEAAKSRKEKEE